MAENNQRLVNNLNEWCRALHISPREFMRMPRMELVYRARNLRQACHDRMMNRTRDISHGNATPRTPQSRRQLRVPSAPGRSVQAEDRPSASGGTRRIYRTNRMEQLNQIGNEENEMYPPENRAHRSRSRHDDGRRQSPGRSVTFNLTQDSEYDEDNTVFDESENISSAYGGHSAYDPFGFDDYSENSGEVEFETPSPLNHATYNVGNRRSANNNIQSDHISGGYRTFNVSTPIVGDYSEVLNYENFNQDIDRTDFVSSRVNPRPTPSQCEFINSQDLTDHVHTVPEEFIAFRRRNRLDDETPRSNRLQANSCP